MRRLRIAVAVHDARPGGGQDRYAQSLANHLAERHDVTLVAARAEGVSHAVHFEQVPLPPRPALIRAPLFAHRVQHLLLGRRWDVVHTVGGAVPGATVITAQFCHLGWRAAQARWPSTLLSAPDRLYQAIVSRQSSSYERRAARAPELEGLIGVSRATLHEWEGWYHPRARVRAVIPNGVDLARFHPGSAGDRAALRERLRLAPGTTVLLLVGTLLRKGIETALEMLAHLQQPQVALVAVGEGPIPGVLLKATGLGVAGQLRLVRHTPDIELFYRGADAFVFPSRYEPFGMAAAEAWASGLPMVASKRVGALEWANPGEHALVVENPADAAGFAAAVRQVLSLGELRNQLATAGRKLAARFTWERVVEETEQAYLDVTARKGGGEPM